MKEKVQVIQENKNPGKLGSIRAISIEISVSVLKRVLFMR